MLLIACLATGLFAGVIGIGIVLPLIACYPIVERTWLRPFLPADTIKLDERLDRES